LLIYSGMELFSRHRQHCIIGRGMIRGMHN
jgi:hypothetical protein